MSIPIRVIKSKSPIRRNAPVPTPFNVVEFSRELSGIEQIKREFNDLKINLEAKQALLDEKISEVDKIVREKASLADRHIQDLGSKVSYRLSAKEREAEERINAIRIEHKGIDGKDGKDAPAIDEKALEERILRKIKLPTPKDGKDSDTEEVVKKVVKHFEEGKAKLSTKHIDGFENSQAVLRNFIARGSLHGGQGQWKQVAVSGTINGVNRTFTFSGEKPAQYSERLFLNYIEQNPLTDYTISGNTITYTVAPDASLSALPHIIRYM